MLAMRESYAGWPAGSGGYEEATLTAPVPAKPHGPRRCGGPEHSV